VIALTLIVGWLVPLYNKFIASFPTPFYYGFIAAIGGRLFYVRMITSRFKAKFVKEFKGFLVTILSFVIGLLFYYYDSWLKGVTVDVKWYAIFFLLGVVLYMTYTYIAHIMEPEPGIVEYPAVVSYVIIYMLIVSMIVVKRWYYGL